MNSDSKGTEETMLNLHKPYKIVRLLCLSIALCLSFGAWSAPEDDPLANIPTENRESKIVPKDQSSDVRVIIDISGSMKENDPDNLRVPALNLIVEMIPDGAQAGVWTFGQWVNMLIPPAQVSDQWRETAKEKSKSINSHGLRTNIGEAMEKALYKFESDGPYSQHTILLTDGLVDIAAENDPQQQQKNEQERQRILTDILKRYKDLGVKIHTIALSDNADKSLLQKLSVDTGGTAEVVNNAEELVKAFLKAFDQAAPEVAEQVPLSEDNTFEIDASVQEFTALVFRKKGSAPTQLTAPSGNVLSQIKGSDNAKWFGESVYDLVTVTNPEAGTWKIDADLDPDNRVTVVSDLKMEIENLPNTLFPNQQIDFEVYLHEDGEIITRPEFLKLMTVEMTMTAENGRSGTKVISDSENVPEDGRYKESIKRLSNQGQYELQIRVDGKTFQRLRKEYIQVSQPVGFEIRKRLQAGVEAYAVRVVPQVPDIEVERTRVIAKLKSPDQTSIIQAMPWVEEGVWEAVIEPNKGPGVYEIAMNVKGRFGEDQEFRIKPDPITLNFPIPEDFSHEYYVKEEMTEQEIADEDAIEAQEAPGSEAQEADPIMPDLAEKMAEQKEEPVEVPEPEAAAEDTAEAVVEEEPVPAEPESIPSWVYILIPVVTMVLGIGGFFVYRMVKNKKAAPAAEPEDKAASGSVALNDGMDDDEFDEDFDLSDSDDDVDLASEGTDLDDLDNLDLSNDEEDIPDLEDAIDDILDEPEEPVTDEVADDIPDFDENFDIDASSDVEPPVLDTDNDDDTAAALDELDSVLDSLTDDEPAAQTAPEPEVNETSEPAEALTDDLDIGADSTDGASEEDESDAAIDEALASLESELDDIDIDELAEDEKKPE